jgi:hypothetical protein
MCLWCNFYTSAAQVAAIDHDDKEKYSVDLRIIMRMFVQLEGPSRQLEYAVELETQAAGSVVYILENRQIQSECATIHSRNSDGSYTDVYRPDKKHSSTLLSFRRFCF